MRLWLAVCALAACDGAAVVDAGVDASAPIDAGACVPFVYTDELADERAACTFTAGASTQETLGIDATHLPIDHLVIVMQENRAFDHYFGTMEGVDGIPATYTNPDTTGAAVSPFHLAEKCLPDDP